MKTNTLNGMSYVIQILSGGVPSSNIDDLVGVLAVFSRLLGSGVIVNNSSIHGTITSSDQDLEHIHNIIEAHPMVNIRIGIARSQSLSDIALMWSDRAGITYIDPTEEDTYLAGIPVTEIREIDKKDARRLQKFQIYTAYDLKYSNRQFIEMNFSAEIVGLMRSYTVEDISQTPRVWYKQLQVATCHNTAITEAEVYSAVARKTNPVSVVSTMDSALSLFNYHQFA